MNVGAHAVDIGHIPSIAVKNLEVLRDGAAAQYGSDAIAGVFNFLLKDANHGAEIQAQVGQWLWKKLRCRNRLQGCSKFWFPAYEKRLY